MRDRASQIRERRRVRAVAAFTLIEVLMSIFVLALGLLGLGALIPGIIREQRVASDRTLGIVVANDAKAYLNARADLRRLALPPRAGLGTGAGQQYGFGAWLRDDAWSETYLWDLNTIDATLFETEGAVVIGNPVGPARAARIPLADRLYPSPSSGLDAPQFVWDFVARRLPPVESEGFGLLADSDVPMTGGSQLDQWRAAVEIAVFVRRVDTGIRVPAGDSAYGLMLRSETLPVGLESTGLPTGTGADVSQSQIYAPPLTLAAEFDGTRRTVLTLSADDSLSGNEPGSVVAVDERLVMASQVGQQLVDNLGNVYTVEELIELDAGSFAEVRVRPAIPGWIPATGSGSWDWDDEEAWSRIRQVVFVPQPPATAIVFRIGVEPNAVRSPSGSGAGRLPL